MIAALRFGLTCSPWLLHPRVAHNPSRPQPDVAKWPSSAGGKGFKPFADKMHAMGLKVGIHTLRGSVSSEAIANK